MDYVKHPLFELAFRFGNLFKQQKDDFTAALYNGGNLYLAPWVKSCYVNRAIWEGMTAAKQKEKFDKLIEGPKTIPEVVEADGLTFKNKTTTARKKNQVRRGKTHTNPRTNKAASHQAEKDLESEEEEQFLGDEGNDAKVEENMTAFEKLQKLIMKKGKTFSKPQPQQEEEYSDASNADVGTGNERMDALNKKIQDLLMTKGQKSRPAEPKEKKMTVKELKAAIRAIDPKASIIGKKEDLQKRLQTMEAKALQKSPTVNDITGNSRQNYGLIKTASSHQAENDFGEEPQAPQELKYTVVSDADDVGTGNASNKQTEFTLKDIENDNATFLNLDNNYQPEDEDTDESV